jgi:hypothetical protein
MSCLSSIETLQEDIFTISVLLKMLTLQGLEPSFVAKCLARHFPLSRSRVLIPGSPDLVCGFFQGISHIITSWYAHRSHITDKANAGSVFTPQNLPPSFRTHPHRTRPESSRQCGWKGSGKPSTNLN